MSAAAAVRDLGMVLAGLDDALVDAAVHEHELAGWDVRADEVDASDGVGAAGEGEVVVVHLDVDLSALDALLGHRVRVLVATTTLSVGCLAYDDLRRVGAVELVTADCVPVTWALDRTQRSLLAAVATGVPLEQAAHGSAVSLRTAARLLTAARAQLGAPTTAAAAALVGARLRHLAP